MRRLLIMCLAMAWPLVAGAQDDDNDEDKGRIVRYLEEALSGLGRDVQIAGFQGALSSQVSMDRMTIADADGVWLTLTGAVLDWNRTAILRGEIEIERISAEKIDIARLPVSDEPASPEASAGFSLPDLPVSVDIKTLAAQEVALGAPILGEPITLTVEGAVTLEGGQGQATLSIERLNGPRGMFALVGSYGNVTRQLAIDLALDEAKDGIAATLLNLPGRPALALSVKGDAPIDEFVADIALKSDGEDRLTGRVSTQAVSDEGSPALEDAPERPRIISVDIAGDMTPLFAPQYRPFFGKDVALQSLVQLYPDGRVDLEKLKLQAASLSLEGALAVSADGLPEKFELMGLLEGPDQEPVVLPIAGPETWVQRAEITALFDASEGDAWIVDADLSGFQRPDMTLAKLNVAANGVIKGGDSRTVTARIDGMARGIEFVDQALTRAIGNALTLGGNVDWSEGEPLNLTDLLLTGEGLELSGAGDVTGLEEAVTFDGAFMARVDDLARLSDIAGRPLSGAVAAELNGEAALLTGAFDLDLNASGRDLSIGIDNVDAALAGESTFSASGKRDENGLRLRAAEVTTAAGTATASGFLRTDESDFKFAAALDDLGRFVAGAVGPLRVSGNAKQTSAGWLTDTNAQGPGGSDVSVEGTLTGLDTSPGFDGKIRARVDDLTPFSEVAARPLSGSVAAELEGAATLQTDIFDLDVIVTGNDLSVGIDKLDAALTGESRFAASGKRDENGLTLRAAELASSSVTASAEGFMTPEKADFEFAAAVDDLSRFVSGFAGPVKLSGMAADDGTGWIADVQGSGPFQSVVEGRLSASDGGEPRAELSGTIGNVGALIPDLPGSASFNAKAQQQGESWAIDTTGQGPGGSTFAVAGLIQSDASRATLDIDGTLPLALANRRLQPRAAQGVARFDLRLDGPLGLSSLSGQLSTSDARVSLPNLQNALSNVNATVTLGGSEAAIKSSAALATGGRLVVDGQVGLQAPFRTNLGIQILDAVLRDPKLFETVARGNLIMRGAVQNNLDISGRINLDRTEIRVPSTGLGGGNIPEINHVGEPRDVRQTRRYAGLLDKDEDSSGTSGGGTIGLDVLIAADSRVFVRGRGLDAELGGRFRITGTAADIIPIGGFDLIRGRLDILGKRLTLDEGTARLQGDFVPGLRLVASTVSDDDTVVSIVIEGRADDPEVRFQSQPELPEDEVLARLLFGRELGSLSAFQALQLASAVATLAGKGGPSFAERIRQGTGVDDFSVSTDSEGTATVGVGKYISDNIYTDVQIGDQSNSEINLNIDLSRRTKLRGSLGSDGGTGVGVFFEKDY